MITITEKAKIALVEIIQKKGRDQWLGLRLKVTGGVPGAWTSDFRPVRPGEEKNDDLLVEIPPYHIFIDPDSMPKLSGVVIDVTPTFAGPSFKIDFPQPKWDDPVAAKLQKLIVDKINPGLASHGGYAALLGVKGSKAEIVLGGGCQGCGLSKATLRQGIEVMIKQEIPEIKEVLDRTDHTAGENPYYKSLDGEPVNGKSPLA